MVDMTKPKFPHSTSSSSTDERVSENSKNEILHLQSERVILIQNMKMVYDVGTQMLKELDTEIDELRIKLRNS